MWVFTNHGFLSIVENRENENELLVRAREPGVLEELFPECAVKVMDDADYRYRAFLPREDVAEFLARQAREIDYGNFKASIPPARKAYHDALLRVWRIMYNLQVTLKQEGKAAKSSAS